MTIPQAAQPDVAAGHEASDPAAIELLSRLTQRAASPRSATEPADSTDYGGIVVGRLLGLVDGGRIPLVVLPEPADSAGLRARSIIDLHGGHVGRQVLLAFEQADRRRPIVMGVLRQDDEDPVAPAPLDVRCEGGRVLLDAGTELVLRCGLSRITLRRDGHVEVQGETILTRASGTNRLQGGSVQLN